MEKAVVLPGIDGFPLHVVLANVVEILLSDVVGRGKFTSIIWKSRGGSTNIDGRYFIPLKKYWLKKRELLCAIDFSDKKQKMIKELSQIEGFSKIYDSYLDAQNRKDGLVKEQNFGKAGTARDEEEKFWQELEYFTDKYANNFLKSFAQSVFAKSLNQ